MEDARATSTSAPAWQFRIEDPVLHRHAPFSPEAEIRQLERAGVDDAAIERRPIVDALIEDLRALVFDPVHEFALARSEFFEVPTIAPGNRQADEAARLDHPSELPNGLTVSVSRDVLDGGNRKCPIERC